MAERDDPARLRPLPARFATLAGGFWSGPRGRACAGADRHPGQPDRGRHRPVGPLQRLAGPLFDLLDRRAAAELPRQGLALPALVLGFGLQSALHLTCRRALQLRWRRWLTDRLAGAWRHRNAAEAGVPGAAKIDGRIAEDIRIATEEAVELGGSLWQATLLLVVFGGLLWEISGTPASPCSATQ